MSKLRHPETRALIVVTVILTTLLVVCGLMIPGKAFAYAADQADSETTQVAQVGVQKDSSPSVASPTSQEASQQLVGDSATQASEAETVRLGGSTSAVSDQELVPSSSESASSVVPSADQGPDGSSGSSTEPTQPTDLPKLTGFVIVSGNTKVGTTLVAGVEGAPEGVSLAYQWYRGESAIPGATANAYTTTIADNNCDISCKVSAEGYTGVLVSGAIRPLSPNQSITVEYWGYTDASPETQVLLKSETANLTDVFGYQYDQNFDTDKTNDRVAYKLLGWQAEGMSSYYDASLSESEFSTTLQDIAALVGWSNDAPLVFHAVQEVRQVTVYYWGNGYEENHDLEPIKVMSWFDVPYLEDIEWKGCALYGQVDDWGDQLDNTMTCGYILSELIDDPWSNELNVYFDWAFLTYEVYLFGYDGLMGINGVCFEDQLDLPTYGSGSYPGYEFVGWFTEPDGAGVQVFDGTQYCSIQPDDSIKRLDLYAFFNQLNLTGSVDISGGASIGEVLFVAVSNTPSDAHLQYQWYRGETPVDGATELSYALTNEDVGANITCRVTDVNYKGSLLSNIIGPIGGLGTQAFAVYSESDDSLSFYKRSLIPNTSDFFAGKVVTAVYTGFEDSAANANWKEYASVIASVTVVDNGIQPRSMNRWFADFSACTFMNLLNLDTSKVTTMSSTFDGCSGLTFLDVSSFDTSNVRMMPGMFDGCSSLTSLDISMFDVSQLVSMTAMFRDCSSLIQLKLPTADTPCLRGLVETFKNCVSLVTLDLPRIAPINSYNGLRMFDGCTALTTIYTAPDADWSAIAVLDSSGDLFSNCPALVGGNGTEFDSDNVDASRACVDGLNGKPGYFTAKPVGN